MNTQSNNTPESTGVSGPGYDDLLRGLITGRSGGSCGRTDLYIAPLIVGVVRGVRVCDQHNWPGGAPAACCCSIPAHQRAMIECHTTCGGDDDDFTVFIIGVFYCLDALHSERRDRSILFWKSLPVSDLTTVLSKATIPFVVLPLVIFGAVVLRAIHHVAMDQRVLLPSGLAATTWTFSTFSRIGVLLYGLIVLALWHAPIYGWALLVSGWARRATFLWAVLPFIAIESSRRLRSVRRILHPCSRIACSAPGTQLSRSSRTAAFQLIHCSNSHPEIPATPGLWIGLAVAAAFVALAVRQRRYRGPI